MTESQNKPKSLLDTAEEQKRAFLASLEALRVKMESRPHVRCPICSEEYSFLKETGMCGNCHHEIFDKKGKKKITTEEEVDDVLGGIYGDD